MRPRLGRHEILEIEITWSKHVTRSARIQGIEKYLSPPNRRNEIVAVVTFNEPWLKQSDYPQIYGSVVMFTMTWEAGSREKRAQNSEGKHKSLSPDFPAEWVLLSIDLNFFNPHFFNYK